MRPRHPRGTPAGGRFAPQAHSEADVTLIEPCSNCGEAGTEEGGGGRRLCPPCVADEQRGHPTFDEESERPNRDASVEGVLTRFRHLPQTPQAQFDTCKATSWAITKALREAGHDARWVQLHGAPPRLDASLPEGSKWKDLSPNWWSHYATQIDGQTIDFTFRQFDPDAAMPAVIDADEWTDIYDITDALDRWKPDRPPTPKT